jgi:hypothetical protein
MKKSFILMLSLGVLFCIVSQLSAMTIDTQINGPDELKNQKDAINKTVETRCLANGIDIGKFNNLNIHINKLGDVYSFDAILDGTPPRAFHKDMKSINDLTSTIDEMIASLFTAQLSSVPVIPVAPVAKIKDTRLNFKATSIILLNDNIYVSGGNTIYLVNDGQATPWWSYKGPGPIFRMWPYKDTVIALIRYNGGYNQDVFVTHQIKDGAVINTWTGVVLPLGNGLAKADISMPPDLTQEINRWSSTTAIDGSPDLLPITMDPLASIRADIMPWSTGNEIITFSPSNGKLLVYSKDLKNPKQSSKSWWEKTKGAFTLSDVDKKALWASETQFSRLPLYLEQIYLEKKSSTSEDNESREQEVDYFLPPRIIADTNYMLTIDNNQGLWGILDKVTIYKSCQIRVYTWNVNDFTETMPLRSTLGYCVDIAVSGDKILALIVTDEETLLRTVNLKDDVI